MHRVAWAFPVAWMALILWLGSDTGSAEKTGRLIMPMLRLLFPAAAPLELEAMHGLVRKLGHVAEYAVLAGLWAAAFSITRVPATAPPPSPVADDLRRQGRPREAWLAWLIALGWAVVDESAQSTVSSRTGSAFDVALDATGALFVAGPVGLGWRRSVDVCTRVALWTAAAGGACLLAVNRLTDVDSGVLWLTVPVAVALILLRRARRSRMSSTALPGAAARLPGAAARTREARLSGGLRERSPRSDADESDPTATR